LLDVSTNSTTTKINVEHVFTAAARVRRATINEMVFMSIPLSILDTLKWIMDVVREREGSLNGSEVDNGAMRNGMCRKFL